MSCRVFGVKNTPMEQQSQLERLGLFDARVPRYTSYPTAPHFTPAIGAQGISATGSAAIPAGAAISLYMHVPFCRRLCWFCACRTQGTQSDDPVRAYAEVLLAELEMLRRESGARRAAVAPALGRRHAHADAGRHDAPRRRAPSLTPFRWPRAPNSRSRSTPTRSTTPAWMRWPRPG
jgi:hypothetical protein